MNFGEHGILDIELNKKNNKKTFIKLDNRMFEELILNISEINSEEELIEKINKLELKENIMYKLILIGNKNFEINKNKIIKLILNKSILKIKNNTSEMFDVDKIIEENSLKSFFVKEVLELKKEEKIDEEVMRKLLEIGFGVL